MYSTHSEVKSVIAERFIKALKKKTCKCMTSISKNVYFDKLDEIFWDVSEEVFVIKKVENAVPWTYIISDLNGEETVGAFYKEELQKTNQKEFRVEKVIKRNAYKLYVKWKSYDNFINCWIDKKGIV